MLTLYSDRNRESSQSATSPTFQFSRFLARNSFCTAPESIDQSEKSIILSDQSEDSIQV